MNQAQQYLEDMITPPAPSGAIKPPKTSFMRKLFYGTPKGKRFYFDGKRGTLFRDTIAVVDAPLSYTYEDVQKRLNKAAEGYCIAYHPNRWEYINHWDDYIIQHYGISYCLESKRNNDDRIRLDSYRKIAGKDTGKPSFLFGWVNKFRKEGVDKNPLGLVEGKTILTSESGRRFRIEKFLNGCEEVELRLLNPRENETVMHTMKYDKISNTPVS